MTLCEAVEPASDPARFEVAMLRARVLLRLDQPDRAIDALRGCAYTPLSADESATAEMLLGAAYVRLGQVRRGAAMLEEAMADARDVHRTIKAEIALNLGIARYLLGNSAHAHALLSSVDSSADIIYARAQEYLGWLAFSGGDFVAAGEAFQSALHAIDHSKHRDRFVEGNVLAGMAQLRPDLLQTDEWPAVDARIRAFDWSSDSLVKPHFWTSIAASIMCEVLGDAAAAREWVRKAEGVSQKPGYQLAALCRMAALFRIFGEAQAQREFVARARGLYERISLPDLIPDLLQVPLALAEELVGVGAHDEAARLMQQYRDCIAPSLRKAPDHDRITALEHTVEAALLESSGERLAAARLYEVAFMTFERTGLRRRACLVALRLADLTGEVRYVEYLRDALAGVPRYWVTRELPRFVSGTAIRLSPTQRDVLQLVADGNTYKEIAAQRGGSWKTARNLVHALFRKFGVRSKGELVAAAGRRRLLERPVHDVSE